MEHPAVDGLSRSEVVVIAELARRPRGMAYRREVARACALSPTTASKAVKGLIAVGLVTETPTVLPLGVARTVNLLRANASHPRWTELLAQLRAVQPAAQKRTSDLADNWTGEWAVADIRKLHDPAAGPKAGCSICARRTARASA